MITFGAKYRATTVIDRCNGNSTEPCNAHFAELYPKDRLDKILFKNAVKRWKKRTDYTGDIFENFRFYSDKRTLNRNHMRYFVLTKQGSLFRNLNSSDILGVTEVSLLGNLNKTVFINYLQVLSDSTSKMFNHVGTGILDCIKKIFKGKDIELDAKETVVPFYEKNGFNIVEGEGRYDDKGNRYVRMRYTSS